MILCLSPVCHNSLPSKYAKSMWNQVLFQSHKNLKSHRPLRWDSQPRYNTVKMLARSLLLVKISLHQHLSPSRSMWDFDLYQSLATNFNQYGHKGSNDYVYWVKTFAFLVSNLKSWYLWTMKPHSTSILKILLSMRLFYTGHVVWARYQSLLFQTKECLTYLPLSSSNSFREENKWFYTSWISYLFHSLVIPFMQNIVLWWLTSVGKFA